MRREIKRASSAATYLKLRPPYPAMIAGKPYPSGYMVLKSQKFDGHQCTTRVWLASSTPWALPLMVLYYVPGSFLKSLTSHTYTWYLNFKLGSIQDWEHLVAVFDKFFYVEIKFSLAELAQTR